MPVTSPCDSPQGRHPARERILGLVEAGTFVELGRGAEPVTPGLDGPADGVVVGFGLLRDTDQTIGVVSYDFAVLAGSQGRRGHRKVVRLLERAHQDRWPVVVFAEGAGARAQELDMVFDLSSTFVALARLSGRVPVVCAVPGPCFAGHAAIAGLSDCIIAVQDATMGMAGPPLVEAALQVKLTPAQIGGMDLHRSSGAVDIVVSSEGELAEAIHAYLSYAVSPRRPVAEPPDEMLDAIVPEQQTVAYDVRRVVRGLSDRSTFLEVRADFAKNAVTGLTRIGGFAVGVVANQPQVLAGAIDTDASDKIARFLRLCDSYRLPLLFLVDTPGFMVGPEAEADALVRHSSRIIQALTHASVPILTVVMRKAFGLAYYALGASPFTPAISLAWPTAAFGGMGLDGAAALLSDPRRAGDGERRDIAASLKDRYAAAGAAAAFGVDDVVDPDQTRDILIRTLAATARDSGRPVMPVDPW
jgi:acetyl-CoA carboxylase carboxyltransferase component